MPLLWLVWCPRRGDDCGVESAVEGMVAIEGGGGGGTWGLWLCSGMLAWFAVGVLDCKDSGWRARGCEMTWGLWAESERVMASWEARDVAALGAVDFLEVKKCLSFLTDETREPTVVACGDPCMAPSPSSTGAADISTGLVPSSTGPPSCIDDIYSSSAGPFNPSPSGSSSAGKSFELRRLWDSNGGNSGISSLSCKVSCVFFRRW